MPMPSTSRTHAMICVGMCASDQPNLCQHTARCRALCMQCTVCEMKRHAVRPHLHKFSKSTLSSKLAHQTTREHGSMFSPDSTSRTSSVCLSGSVFASPVAVMKHQRNPLTPSVSLLQAPQSAGAYLYPMCFVNRTCMQYSDIHCILSSCLLCPGRKVPLPAMHGSC